MTTTQDVPEGERLTRLETIVDSLLREVSELRADMRQLRADMSELRADMGELGAELRSEIQSRFLWTLGVTITMWVTIILAIVLKP